MKKNNFLIAIFSVCVCFASLYAQEVTPKSVEEPYKGEVILVGRVIYKGNINREARLPKDADPEFFKDFDRLYLLKGKNDIYRPYNCEVGKPFFIIASPNKTSKKVRLETFLVCFFSNADYSFYLPVMANVIIPEGAKYVYIGTFEYELDYALRVKSVKRYDEYNDACEWLKIATGKKDVELIRAELEPIEED